MKRGYVILAALSLLLLAAGCKRGDDARQRPDMKKDAAREGGQQPYYHGLIEEYRTILAEDPHNRAATIALANAFYDSGQWSEAITYYERAARLEPHDYDILTDLGTCYRNIGKPDKAIEQYRTVLRHNPRHLNARYNLGVVFANDKKDYAAAVHEWEELLRIAPGYHHAAVMRQAIRRYQDKMAGKGEQ